jgi:DNA polymerase III subunit delta'
MSLQPWLHAHWQQLCERWQSQRFPHALMLAGPAGLGKRDLARALVERILCTKAQGFDFACGQCRTCVFMKAGSHPDYVHVALEARDDGKLRSEIVVDQIRLLSGRLAAKPQLSGWQVTMIDPADAMNTAAANALLKTLEEPAASTLLLLVADEPARLPATIRSRCQRIDMPLPNRELANQWLRAQGINDTEADVALWLCDDNPGAALTLTQAKVSDLVCQLQQDLSAVATGRSITEVAARWAAADTEMLFNLLARITAQWTTLPRSPKVAEAMHTLAGLTAQADFNKLSLWWRNLNIARARLSTPLRKDVAIIELLDEWFRAVNARTS